MADYSDIHVPPDISLPDLLHLIVILNSSVLTESILYGCHIILFFICIFILCSNRRAIPWYSLTPAFIMFALSTADMAFTIRLGVHDLPSIAMPNGTEYLRRRVYPKNRIFVANNLVALLTLVYRCYTVWDRAKYALAGITLAVVLDTVLGFIALGSSFFFSDYSVVPIYVWIIFALNVIITGITVGRIFWVAKCAKPWVGDGQVRSYHLAIAILLESSAIYCGCLLAYILFPIHSLYRCVVISLCMRLVSIMPTLLIVQVGLARRVLVSDTHAITTDHRDIDDVASATESKRSSLDTQGTLPGPPMSSR